MNLGKSIITLGLVAFISGFLLSHLYKVTYPEIVRQEKEKQQKSLALVLPGYKVGNVQKAKLAGKDVKYWVGEKSVKSKEGTKKEKGYAFITSKPGYSGDVISMVGIDQDGKIIGLSLLQQTETPGLGARSEEIASKLTFFGFIFGSKQKDTGEKEILIPWFQQQFSGLNIRKKIRILKKGDWKPEMKKGLLKHNAISAITGATITSRAVANSMPIGAKLLDYLAAKKPAQGKNSHNTGSKEEQK